MATGGIANVIYKCPLRFPGLYTIGLIFMIINLIFFLFNTVCISLRFYYWPKTFRASLLHPTESLFAPAPVISIAIILVNITEYAVEGGETGGWLVIILRIFYWMYVALAVAASVTIYLIM